MARRHARSCEISTLGFDRVVQVLRERVVDDPDHGDAVDGEAEGDADVGVGVDEIGGAIYGVDYEAGA